MVLHLAADHPLAEVAFGYCQSHVAPLVGGVACGSCWEQAIRDDERFAVENELPRELHLDPDLVDEVAVERAMQGIHVRLTAAERTAAITALSSMGVPPSRVARLLDSSSSTGARELAQLGRAAADSAAA